MRAFLVLFITVTIIGSVTSGARGEETSDTFEPIYINDAGDGILRYSAPDGVARQYWLAIGMHRENRERPFETWSGDIGPFSGPEVAVSFAYIRHSQIPLDKIAFELYEKEPYKKAARFRPVIDPEQAETADTCGKISPVGECHAGTQ